MPVTVRGTDILFNDGTTQSTAAVVNTTAVLNATAGASVGAVGTYALLGESSQTTTQAGGTRPGSALAYMGFAKASPWPSTSASQVFGSASTTVSGTWRCMGYSLPYSNCFANFFPATLWLRIS
jgi:hypothetical protein